MGRLVGPRDALVALLEAELATRAPQARVAPWLGGNEEIAVDMAIVVAVAARSADREHPRDFVELDVWAVSATKLDAASEADLEAFTDHVLDVLDDAGVRWSNADRAVWKDSHPAYRIEVEYLT